MGIRSLAGIAELSSLLDIIHVVHGSVQPLEDMGAALGHVCQCSHCLPKGRLKSRFEDRLAYHQPSLENRLYHNYMTRKDGLSVSLHVPLYVN